MTTNENTGGAGGPQETPRREQLPPPANNRRDERHIDERRTEVHGRSVGSGLAIVGIAAAVAAVAIALMVFQPWKTVAANTPDTPTADATPKCTRDLTGREVCCNRPGYWAKLETQNQSFRGQTGTKWEVICHFNMARFKRDTGTQ